MCCPSVVQCLVSQIDPSVPQPVFTITEKAPTRAFSWLKVPTSAFTLKTLLRHYAKWALTHSKVDMKVGHLCKDNGGEGKEFVSIHS